MVNAIQRNVRSVVIGMLVVSMVSGCKKMEDADTSKDDSQSKDTAAVAANVAPFLCGDEKGQHQFGGLSPELFVKAFEVKYGISPKAINEAHDCQQLIVQGQSGGRDAYGALVTLWVDDALPGPGGYDQGALVAVINADTPVPALKLNGTENCVYLKENGNHTWSASIAVRTGGGQCPQTIPAGAVPLAVTTMPPTGPEPRPVGGRIHEGPNYTYFFGIQCLPDLWCVIGNTTVPAGHIIAANAHGDRQRLSFKIGTTLVASQLTATISPETNLQNFKQSWFERARGIKVATITIDGIGTDPDAEAAYINKWRITQATLPPRVNVYLRRDPSQPDITKGWYLRFTDTGNEFSNNQNSGTHAGPGTTRWRWSKSDEGVWVQCLKGCCSDW
jgi:hypothetical protein